MQTQEYLSFLQLNKQAFFPEEKSLNSFPEQTLCLFTLR